MHKLNRRTGFTLAAHFGRSLGGVEVIDSHVKINFVLPMIKYLIIAFAITPIISFAKQSLSDLHNKAESGDSNAQFSLGQKYLRGECKMLIAIDGLLKDALKGDVKAQISLGDIYQGKSDSNISQDNVISQKWYGEAFRSCTKIAKKNDPFAHLALASMYRFGMGVKRDESKAEEWFQKAFQLYLKSAQNGDCEAQCAVAKLYERGSGVSQDMAKAVEWHEKAIQSNMTEAEKGDAYAQWRLADLYRGIKYTDGYLHGSDRILQALWNDRALKSYDENIEKYGSVGIYVLTEIHDSGKCINGDPLKAAHIKAVRASVNHAEKGNVEAQLMAARLYDRGLSISLPTENEMKRSSSRLEDRDLSGATYFRDESKSSEWFQKAFQSLLKTSDNGGAKELYELAKLYESGKGVTADKHKATKLYQRAFELFRQDAAEGDANAQFSISEMYDDRIGVLFDKEKAEEVYQLAFQSSLQDAKKGDANAQRRVAEMYLSGKGIEKSESKGFAWLKVALQSYQTDAENDDFIAQSWVAELLPVERLITDDKEWTIQGALRRKTESKIAQLEKAAALKWFQRAAESGNPEAMMVLGSALYTGSGVPRDFNKALGWLLAAAQKKQSGACQLLGEMYATGRGVAKNYVLAWIWYSIATDFDRAKSKFDSLLENAIAVSGEATPNPGPMDPPPHKMLLKLEQAMTPEQLASAIEQLDDYVEAIKNHRQLPTP